VVVQPTVAEPFSHACTNWVTSRTRKELALPTGTRVAKAVEANAGGEELFSVDSLQSPVTG
jgi:hypothetical protein